jgi:hypothetical protein
LATVRHGDEWFALIDPPAASRGNSGGVPLYDDGRF